MQTVLNVEASKVQQAVNLPVVEVVGYKGSAEGVNAVALREWRGLVRLWMASRPEGLLICLIPSLCVIVLGGV